MRIKNAPALLDYALRDTRQNLVDIRVGGKTSVGRMVVLLVRLWLGTKLLQLVCWLGL